MNSLSCRFKISQFLLVLKMVHLGLNHLKVSCLPREDAFSSRWHRVEGPPSSSSFPRGLETSCTAAPHSPWSPALRRWVTRGLEIHSGRVFPKSGLLWGYLWCLVPGCPETASETAVHPVPGSRRARAGRNPEPVLAL